MSRHKFEITVSGVPSTNFVSYNGMKYMVTNSPGGLYEFDPADGSASLINSIGNSNLSHQLLVHNGIAIVWTSGASDNLFGYDIDAGSVVWSYSVGRTASGDSGMALNPSADEFYVCPESSGTLQARDVSNGTLNWSDTISGDHASTQMVISGGRLFFGDDGGVVYSVDLSAQQVDWSSTTGESITRGMDVTTNGLVVFGTGSWSYGFDVETGTEEMSHFNGCYNVKAVPGGRYWCAGPSDLLLIDATVGSTDFSVSTSNTQVETQIALDPGSNGVACFYGARSSVYKADETEGGTVWSYTADNSIEWPVHVDGNDIWTGIDGQVIAIVDQYPQIAGTVTDTDGNSVEGAEITVIDEVNETVVDSTTTAADGTYSMTISVGDTVHVLCEYTDTEGDMHTASYPYVTPEAPS